MKKIISATILVLTGFLQTPAYAGDVFEITIQIFKYGDYYNTVYYPPPKNIIKVQDHGPVRPFRVVLKNISSTTRRLNTDLASQGFDLITFETSDERGNSNVVTKKIDASKSKSQGYTYIGPGQTKEFEIVLTPSEWNNAYKLSKEGAAKLRGRVSYKNGSDVIYSDYYTIILED